jgi:hypothetical protein
MSITITDEMVEAGAKASRDKLLERDGATIRELARAALSAAAPLIETAVRERCAAIAEQKTPGEWRMDAYYYSFTETGVASVDRILSAVAHAGKACHHTEDWYDKAHPAGHLRGDCPVEWVQNAANDAAAAIRADGGAE